MARTPKAKALGAALRQAREDKGLLLRELAATINRDIGVLSRWETGDRTPKPEQVAQILTRLDVDQDRYDEIMSLVYGTDQAQWVAITLPEQRQQMAAYVDWEQNATRIVEVAPPLVPGLLQTSDYIHAIMTGGGVPTGEIASRVTYRIGRREVITKPVPAHLVVFLGQGALNQNIGGPDTRAGQIRHLIDMARPNIDLRIMPDRAGWHPGLEGAFALIEAHRTTSNTRSRNTPAYPSEQGAARPESIVFVGTRRSVMMLHEPDDVDAYKRAVDSIARASWTPTASLAHLTDLTRPSQEAPAQ